MRRRLLFGKEKKPIILYKTNGGKKLASASTEGATAGLHPNSFSGLGEQLEIIEHNYVYEKDESGNVITNIGTIEFNNTLEDIGDYAFYNCGVNPTKLTSGLTEVTFPSSNNLKTIGNYAFAECYQLRTITNINSQANLTSIGDYAFYKCNDLLNATLQNTNVKTIGVAAYSGCTNLGYPNGFRLPFGAVLEEIGASAFTGCRRIGTIVGTRNSNLIIIPSSLAEIKDHTFYRACLSGGNFSLDGVNYNNTGIVFRGNSIVSGIGESAFEQTDMRTIIIPSATTIICDRAFHNCSSLSSFTFQSGSSLDSIGASAYSYCTKLKAIDIPSSTTVMGDQVCYSCTTLSSCTFESDSTIESIGASAFSYCTSLKSMKIPNTAVYMGDHIFYKCSGLTSFTFDEVSSVSGINEYSFEYCSNLRSIHIPDSAEKVGKYAFAYCDNLKQATIGSGTTLIDDYAFYYDFNYAYDSFYQVYRYSGLSSCTFAVESKIDKIGKYAFAYDGRLSVIKTSGTTDRIEFPKSLRTIDGYAFYRCTGLTSACTFESVSNLERINDYAFEYCTNLKGVALPSGTTYLGKHIFSYCPSMTSMTVDEGSNPVFISENNSILSGDSSGDRDKYTVLVYGCEGTNEIPSAVTDIDTYAFEGHSAMTYIKMDDNSKLKTIGSYAFKDCHSLDLNHSEEMFPSGLTAIGYFAFINNYSLKDVHIQSKLTSASTNPFANCYSLSSITVDDNNDSAFYSHENGENYNVLVEKSTQNLVSGCKNSKIPSAVTSIGSYAFCGHSGLTEIEIPSATTTIKDYAFSACTSLSSCTFAEGSQLTSISGFAFDNCTNLASITIPSGVTVIGGYAFYNCTSLSSCTFEEGSQLTSISGRAFYNCSSLASITIPSGVTVIGGYEFYNCKSLSSCTFEEGSQLTLISGSAFYGCTNLASITIPSGVTVIGGDAFYNCTSLSSCTFAEGSQLTSISGFAFDNCTNLASITIPSGVTSVGNNAFRSCSKLSSCTFAEGSQLSGISSSAFRNCYALQSITIPSGVRSIGDSAFTTCSSMTTCNIDSASTSMTSIGEYAFYGDSALTSIIVQSSVNGIGSYAFAHCKNLRNVYVYAETPPSLGSSAFYNAANDLTIYVPSSKVDVYKNATNWKSYSSKISPMT